MRGGAEAEVERGALIAVDGYQLDFLYVLCKLSLLRYLVSDNGLYEIYLLAGLSLRERAAMVILAMAPSDFRGILWSMFLGMPSA